MKVMKIIFASFLLISISIIACVPIKQYQEMEAERNDCLDQKGLLESLYESLQVDSTEMAAKISQMEKLISSLEADTNLLGETYREAKATYEKLRSINESLSERLDGVKRGSEEELARLMEELQDLQNDLQIREDRLRELEASLDDRKYNLDNLQSELENKNRRLIELERIIFQRDSLANAIQAKLENALAAFRDQGISIEKRGDRIYVLLDEKLLFQSGKWEVDPLGKQALIELAEVLAQSKEINVLIEGHTDDVPLHGSGDVLDNWDLSVKRATAIVRILLENEDMEPQRITAAGRAEYVPVENGNTAEARQKNRRTEIILIPDVDYSQVISE